MPRFRNAVCILGLVASLSGCATSTPVPVSHRPLAAPARPAKSAPAAAHKRFHTLSFDEKVDAIGFTPDGYGLLVFTACPDAHCRTMVDSSSDGGETWRTAGSMPIVFRQYSFPTLTLVSRSVAVLGIGWSDVAGYRLLASTDNGHSWTRERPPCPRYDGIDLSSPPGSASVMWALCAGEPGAGNEPKALAVSYDAGMTWIRRPDPEGGGYSIGLMTTSPRAAWRFGGGRAPLFRSVDGGESWQILLPGQFGDGGGGQEYWFDPVTTTAAWVLSDPNSDHRHPFMLRTTDAGQSWQSLTVPFG